VAFHHALIDATGSTLLRHMADRLGAYWFLFPQDRQRMTVAHSEHVAVLEALAKGDSQGAVRVLRRHLRRHLEEQIAMLTELSRKAAASPVAAASRGAVRAPRSTGSRTAPRAPRAARIAGKPRSRSAAR
jgi:hypothetical protein